MINFFFLACTLISFNLIHAQPQCEKMINDLKEKMLNDRPQDFDLAMKEVQTFTSNWMISGCNRDADEFIVMSNELGKFIESVRNGEPSNNFNFSFESNEENNETNDSLNEKDLEEVEEKSGFGNKLMEKYAEGGVGFMTCVLICLILGLALCIERIIYLHLASSNTKS
jgi:hypothetical protein